MTDDLRDRASELATFAGGCFWCMQGPFAALAGVLAVRSGYTGGTKVDPTYEEVCSGTTGHAEAVEVRFDPARISYESLLEVFWRQIDPTQVDGQFADRGTQYRTAIFWHDERQRALAEASKRALAESGRFDRPIATELARAGAFYPAEAYHQEYFKKNPLKYKLYRRGSGRGDFLARAWGEAERP